MKIAKKKFQAIRAFTFAEMGVAIGVLGLLGLVFFQVLQSGMILSAKNTAVNAAHEEARQGILRLTRDIHASISVPQLRDSSFAVISSTPSPSASPGATPPTAPAISFQNVFSGPNWIWNDPGGNNGMIMIKDGIAGPPSPGMHMIIPAWGIEDDITSVTGSPSTQGHSNVTTVHGYETGVKRSPQYQGAYYAITYYTNRSMYAVLNGSYVADSKGDFNLVSGQYVQVPAGTGGYHYENGELHYYVQAYNSSTHSFYWQDKATVARYLSSPRPFSVPLNQFGGSDNRYVQVSVSARDPKTSNRGYLATSTLLDTKIDYRSRLTIYQ
jgi:type II secretory pathway pseudopilin PulG